MSDSRLPKQAYKMQLKLDENLNPCWVTRTKNFLCDFGFTDVWQQQGVGDERIFLSVLKQRLLEKYNQEWLNAVNTSNRFSFYVTFKSSLLPEQYFDCVTLNCYGDALIKIRLGVLPINSLDALKMTRKSCVTFVKFRWRMKFTSSVCARYITGSG